MTAKSTTNWVEVFTKTRAILGSDGIYIYHGPDWAKLPTTDPNFRCRCLWTASLDGYEDVTGVSLFDQSEDKEFVVNVLRQAVGLEAQSRPPDPGPVYKWNDTHTDEEVLAAADRAIALVS